MWDVGYWISDRKLRCKRQVMKVVLVVGLFVACLGCAHHSATSSAAAFDQVTAELAAYSQAQKDMDAKVNDMSSKFSTTDYKLSGISYEDALAKIEPILSGAGFKEHTSRLKTAVFFAAGRHQGFVMLDDARISATDPELIFFTVTRPKR